MPQYFILLILILLNLGLILGIFLVKTRKSIEKTLFIIIFINLIILVFHFNSFFVSSPLIEKYLLQLQLSSALIYSFMLLYILFDFTNRPRGFLFYSFSMATFFLLVYYNIIGDIPIQSNSASHSNYNLHSWLGFFTIGFLGFPILYSILYVLKSFVDKTIRENVYQHTFLIIMVIFLTILVLELTWQLQLDPHHTTYLASFFIFSFSAFSFYLYYKFTPNITDMKAAQENIFRAISEGIILLDEQGKILYLNQAAKDFLQINEERNSPQKLSNYIPQFNLEQNYSDFRTILTHEESMFFMSISTHKIYSKIGKKQILVVLTDKTIESIMEKQLSFSLQEIKGILNNQLIGLTISKNNRIVWLNNKFAQILGYSPEELLGQNLYRLAPTLNYYLNKIHLIYSTIYSQKIFRGEVRLKHKKGHEIFARVFSEKIIHQSNHHNTYLWGVEDISQQREYQLQLIDSEAKYRAIFQQISIGIIAMDLNGKIIEINPALIKITGYTFNEVIGTNYNQYLYEEDYNEVQSIIHSLRTHENPLKPFVFRIKTKNPHPLWFKINLSFVDNVKEKYSFYLGVIEDITEKHLTQEALMETQTRWQFALESSGDGVWDWYPQEEKVFYSKQWKLMLGYDNGEITDSEIEFTKRLHPEDYKNTLNYINQFITKSDNTFEREFRLRCKDNTYKWILSRGKCISRDTEGQPLRIIGTNQDITERKITEEKIKNYAKQIEYNLNSKQESLLRAQAIQRNLIAKEIPNLTDINISAFYMPSEEIGGDFLDIELIDNQLIILIGDCTGHGIEASIDSVLLKSISDRYKDLLLSYETDKFITAINNDIHDYFNGENFLTMFAAVIDIETKTMVYSNANQDIPYIVNKGKITELPLVDGFHIGFEKDYPFDRNAVQLNEGDILFFYSDSIREMMTREGKMLGKPSIEKIIQEFRTGLNKNLNYMVNQLEMIHGFFPLEDDTTLVLIEHKEPYHQRYSVYTRRELESIDQRIQDILHNYDYNKTDIYEILISYEEMYLNALCHGNQNNPDKIILVDFYIDFHKVEIIIEDQGNGFNPEDYLEIDDISLVKQMLKLSEDEPLTKNMGIFLTKNYMDDLYYSENGKKVTLLKNRSNKEIIFKNSTNHSTNLPLGKNYN